MNKSVTAITITLPLVLLGMLFVQFLLSNDLASVGEKVYNIDTQIQSIEEENEYLKQQVAVAKSLRVIEKKATDLGFVQPTRFVTLPDSQSVALR